MTCRVLTPLHLHVPRMANVGMRSPTASSLRYFLTTWGAKLTKLEYAHPPANA